MAQADRAARDADRQELMVRIGRTEVRAPVDGLISLARRGSAAAALAGDPLFRIISARRRRPYRRRAGAMAVAAQGWDAGDLAAAGRRDAGRRSVRQVDQQVDKASRTGKARLALADVSHARSAPSPPARSTSRAATASRAPATAVRREGGDGVVLIVKDGVVEDRKVKLGIVEGDEIELISGVSPGETLVARAASFLRPGDKVRPMAQVAGAGG